MNDNMLLAISLAISIGALSICLALWGVTNAITSLTTYLKEHYANR